MQVPPYELAQSDPLFPASAALQLSGPGGLQHAVAHVPGVVRPFAATLAVPAPVEAKRHDTTATRNSTQDPTQRSYDGKVVPDTVPDTTTDT